jgi:hypothetical protein
MDYDTATMAELEAEFKRLAQVLASASNERVIIDAEMMKRMRLTTARERVRAMSDRDKDALRAVLNEGRR